LDLKDRKQLLKIEVDSNLSLLDLGFKILKETWGVWDKIHMPVFLLSFGYEKLLKCTLCYVYTYLLIFPYFKVNKLIVSENHSNVG